MITEPIPDDGRIDPSKFVSDVDAFREPIVAMVEHGQRLYVATARNVYRLRIEVDIVTGVETTRWERLDFETLPPPEAA